MPRPRNNAKSIENLSELLHPEYVSSQLEWRIWRLTYEGGPYYIQEFLKKHSEREDDTDFFRRKTITYNPAFAKAAVNEIKNSIYQRLVDVTREGGPQSYLDAVDGGGFGVDMLGRSMNTFLGIEILHELLVMKKVGIYVDMPSLDEETTLFDKGKRRPYIYTYKAEDIRSWTPDLDYNPSEFQSLLLIDRNYQYDDLTGLPSDMIEQYRLLMLKEVDDGDGVIKRRVFVQYFDSDSSMIGTPIRLEIDRIPFVMLEITESLLKDAAMYQAALLNLASSDLDYCLKANYPFYTEQYDPHTRSPYLKPEQSKVHTETDPFTFISQTETTNEIRVGATSGRRYPVKTERPGFIHPSSEPITASMAKQEQLKEEIRLLVGLNLSDVKPKMASAESKEYDEHGLEAGLSYIGFVLQYAERKIAEFWSLYEGSKEIPTVNYPETYSLQSDDDRRKDAEALLVQLKTASSDTLRKRIAKRIADLQVGCYVKQSELQAIYKELDNAPFIIPDMDFIFQAIQNGMLALKDAAKVYGLPNDTVANAEGEHARRLERIQKAQTSPDAQARGVRDLGADPTAGQKEKAASRDTTQDPVPSDKTRGNGQYE